MPELPPYVWLVIVSGAIGYWLGVEVWHGLLYLWHALPAIGHGLLHVLTFGIT
ncbi:MAG: hypothetical protein NUW22_12525 [Acidobacteria bacterium]|nr:hypothetical protein [Acidobacteriota bacterium]